MDDLQIKLSKWIVTISKQGFVIVRRAEKPKTEWFFYSSGDVQVTVEP